MNQYATIQIITFLFLLLLFGYCLLSIFSFKFLFCIQVSSGMFCILLKLFTLYGYLYWVWWFLFSESISALLSIFNVFFFSIFLLYCLFSFDISSNIWVIFLLVVFLEVYLLITYVSGISHSHSTVGIYSYGISAI